MIYLKKLAPDSDIEIYNMLQEIAGNDNGFHNKVYGMSYAAFCDWLAKEFSVDNGNLEEWMVPQTSYWLYDNETPVGYGRIRHILNDTLAQTSGHIGYAIRKTERNKGYGSRLLSLLLEECKMLNIETVQISANIDNIASNKIIIKNGGKLFRTSKEKQFYHIELDKP